MSRANHTTYKLICFLLLISLFLPPFSIKADTIDDLQKKINEFKGQQKVLEDQRAEYAKSLLEKQKTAANLENQIALLDNEISLTKNKIGETELNIEKAILEIEKLNAEIIKKEQDISRQSEVLSSLMREIFEQDSETTLSILLKNNNFSDFLNDAFYLEQTQNKITDSIENLKTLKEQSEWQRKQEVSKKEELDNFKNELIVRQTELDLTTASKKELLGKTKGEQSRYENLLKRVEEQRNEILGNIEELMRQKAAELARVQAGQLKPAPNPKAEAWHYYQTDPRWGDSFIGFSKSTMKDYGCAVASLAMIFKYHNLDITPGQLARERIFYYDLIVWPQLWKSVRLIINTNHRGVDWNSVDYYLENSHPVIVFVKADGKNAGHYVAIFDKDSRGYIVNDPMWGSNIYLDSTRQNIATLYNTTTTIEQVIVYK